MRERLPAHYAVSYAILGSVPQRSFPDLLEIIDKATVRHTGWSPFWVPTRKEIKPYIQDDAIECDLNEDGTRWVDDPAHADFWRVAPDGKALLIRGYDEDSSPARVVPGTVIDVTLPVWRVGECVLQAANFATLLVNEPREINFRVKWTGLQGRELASVERTRDVRRGRKSQQDSFTAAFHFHSDTINDQLPEVLFAALRPLYALFDFFELPKSLVDTEVARLRSGRF